MKKIKAYISLFSVSLLLFGIVLQALPPKEASANQITARKLTLQAGSNTPFDGGSKPGGTVNHLFNFTVPTVGGSGNDVGSIRFQYCTTAAAVPLGIDCVAPTGIDVSGVSLGNEVGATGFTGMDKQNIDDDTGSTTPLNTVILERPSASALTTGVLSYRLDGVVNPSTPQTFFVRISTYGSTNGTGTAIDTGTVAAATSTQIIISGTMPESLVFCAGKTVGLSGGGVPDCSTVTTGVIDFDRLFSPTDTALATSQMAASTNAGTGYAITVNGPTMTSGSNTITGMSSASKSLFGVSQFGMNVVLNDGTDATNLGPNMTTMPTGYAPSANVAPTSNGTNYNAAASLGYDSNGKFKFVDTDPVATSANKGTDAQIYTASYIVNVPGSQPAGTYSTTLTYICTATF